MSETKDTRPSRTVEYSQIENLHVVRGEDINGTGRLYGGRLLSWIDETAATCAQRHSGLEITTASIDNLTFKRGAYTNDIVVLVAKVTYVGHTSMEVRVNTYVEDMDGYRHPINRAYLTYVAITRDGKPLPIPYSLEITKENERIEWEAALKRRANRKHRSVEGF
ncbi:MAG: acyl-CoA thioesterase [Lachnospiraceae bacterium]|nr:acyl-CoA thioesterase [Lachnospiraceae bacterium]